MGVLHTPLPRVCIKNVPTVVVSDLSLTVTNAPPTPLTAMTTCVCPVALDGLGGNTPVKGVVWLPVIDSGLAAKDGVLINADLACFLPGTKRTSAPMRDSGSTTTFFCTMFRDTIGDWPVVVQVPT